MTVTSSKSESSLERQRGGDIWHVSTEVSQRSATVYTQR